MKKQDQNYHSMRAHNLGDHYQPKIKVHMFKIILSKMIELLFIIELLLMIELLKGDERSLERNFLFYFYLPN